MLLPGSELLGNGVQEPDTALGIRGNHGITDARQRRAEPLALLVENRRGLLAGQETTMEQPDERSNQAQPNQSGEQAGRHGGLIGKARPALPVPEQVVLVL